MLNFPVFECDPMLLTDTDRDDEVGRLAREAVSAIKNYMNALHAEWRHNNPADAAILAKLENSVTEASRAR